MRRNRMPSLYGMVALAVLALLDACGGGTSNTQPPPLPPPPQVMTITSSNLPGTLFNAPYSFTLQAANGVGALKWSIAPISATTLFVDGLSIDPSTGLLSGTVGWQGGAGFTASVSDSSSPPRSGSKSFVIGASPPLLAPPPQTFQVAQFRQIYGLNIPYSGGVQPLTYTVTGGALPVGFRIDLQTGQMSGSAVAVGNSSATVTIQDSYSPPEVATAQVNFQVIPPTLQIAGSLPRQMLLNRSFSGRVIAVGGIPPYHFVTTSGTAPTGLSSVDPNSGQLNGTPTAAGNFSFSVTATDSSPSPQTANNTFFVTVVNPMGRNDTPATATPIGNGQISASISPYVDPPATPYAADHDYYKLISVTGATVHIEIQARRWWPGDPLDSVLEITDGNGARYGTCRQPGVAGNVFTSACINDDIDAQTTDSSLDFSVPGPTNMPITFYAHVFDWRGDARPDMVYALQVSGLVAPLGIQTTSMMPAARGLSYSQPLLAVNGIGTVSWSVTGGSLPPGMTLDPSGFIMGPATTDGNYSFVLQATDSANPPQTVTAQESILVVDPVQIVSPAILPDACVGQPYSFAMQASGGAPPIQWGFFSANWVGINLDLSTGVFSGFSTVTGTFVGTVGANDATQHGSSLQITLNVVNCPGG